MLWCIATRHCLCIRNFCFMIIQIPLVSQSCLSFGRLRQLLGIDNLVLHMGPDEMPGTWAFYREGMSVTLFLIQQTDNGYLLSMDGLASYDDYRFLPYLVDSLSLCLNNEPFTSDGCSAYELYNENWVADTMGEEVAYLKCYLQLGLKYYLSLPIPSTNVCVDVATLRSVGVSIHSATPRIYGYVHYLLRANRLPCDEEVDNGPVEGAGEVEVDVPQHQSIGTVLSWQTDGSETTESYGREDVELLLQLAEAYRRGEPCDGVVLNDIATIYEHGIGVEADAEVAAHWYREAIRQGDHTFAPTSLGDLYRKGAGRIAKDLHRAVAAYRQSVDPYAWYRLGQSYEEGWLSTPDLDKAMEYYHRAAAVHHHLALKRLGLEH